MPRRAALLHRPSRSSCMCNQTCFLFGAARVDVASNPACPVVLAVLLHQAALLGQPSRPCWCGQQPCFASLATRVGAKSCPARYAEQPGKLHQATLLKRVVRWRLPCLPGALALVQLICISATIALQGLWGLLFGTPIPRAIWGVLAHFLNLRRTPALQPPDQPTTGSGLRPDPLADQKR